MEFPKNVEKYFKESKTKANMSLTYKWESSVPDLYKTSSKKIVVSSYQKLPSLEYLRFSGKVLQEYSKVMSLQTRKLMKNQSFQCEKNSESSFVNIERTQNRNYGYRSNSSFLGKSQKKIQEFKSFSFGSGELLNDDYMIHNYSIPNGLNSIKSMVRKPKRLGSNELLNSNLKVQRKCMAGGKICKIGTHALIKNCK